jgi:hypothetical protein
MSEKVTIAMPTHLPDNVIDGDIEASAASAASTVRRWVGGSAGYVYHTDNTRFVGGCAGAVHGF